MDISDARMDHLPRSRNRHDCRFRMRETVDENGLLITDPLYLELHGLAETRLKHRAGARILGSRSSFLLHPGMDAPCRYSWNCSGVS